MILITSFATWRHGQRTNSSDQLLTEYLRLHDKDDGIYPLRRLPVHAHEAGCNIIRTINRLKPETVILCGQGKSRRYLVMERQAQTGNRRICSHADISYLAAEIPLLQTSRYAGKFVCNSTYFHVLNYLDSHRPRVRCVFVHTPVRNRHYWPPVVNSFNRLMDKFLF